MNARHFMGLCAGVKIKRLETPNNNKILMQREREQKMKKKTT